MQTDPLILFKETEYLFHHSIQGTSGEILISAIISIVYKNKIIILQYVC